MICTNVVRSSVTASDTFYDTVATILLAWIILTIYSIILFSDHYLYCFNLIISLLCPIDRKKQFRASSYSLSVKVQRVRVAC